MIIDILKSRVPILILIANINSPYKDLHLPKRPIFPVPECRDEAVRDLPVRHEVRPPRQLRLQRRHDRPDAQPDPGLRDAQGSSHRKLFNLQACGLDDSQRFYSIQIVPNVN